MGDLAPIDLIELTEVVRLDQQSPAFEVLDWSIRILSDRGAINPEGVLCVSGTGRDAAGTRPWSVALKLIVPGTYGDHPSQRVYWKRELLAYTSGTLARMPGPVTAARCYRAREEAHRVWIWMEVLTDVTGGRWTLHDYAFVAEQLGRFNGLCALGEFHPDVPWLARTIAREWTAEMDFATAWQKPHVQQAFAPTMHQRLEQLAGDRERLLAVLEALPQVFCHGDAKRSNMFICQQADQDRTVVAVDWSDCGMGTLGGDLVFLVGGSAWFLDWEPAQVTNLSNVAYDAYLGGLRAVGWSGNEQHVRLAYTSWMALHFGLILPTAYEWVMSPENHQDALRLFGRQPDAILAAWEPLCQFTLDCADEARGLLRQLNWR